MWCVPSSNLFPFNHEESYKMRKLIAVLLLSSIYYSDVIHVPDDHATIQEALTASVNGLSLIHI